ncbi:hypothetical protein AAIR98_001843 [Elusimicrobium simillimum]|uniref:hypothetical protein n=1 Tax=Elusimicrobium simillimum TaxID=3143438 RepID=UPI003C705B6D
MLRKLAYVVCLTLVTAVSSFAATDIWKDKLFIDGEVRTFGIFDKDIIDRTGPAGATVNYNTAPTRILFGAGYRITPDITVFARAGYFTLWGSDKGQTFASDTLDNKLNFAEGYAEFKNIFDTFDIKLGRQFYASDDVFYKPLGYSVERNLYAAIDGASAKVRIKGTEVQLLAGKEADLIWGELADKYAFGFQSTTKVNDYLSLYLSAYNIHTEHVGDYTLLSAKPTVKYKNATAFFRYIANRNEEHQHGQFFHADARYKQKAGSVTLTPKASVIWGTGTTHWNTITYLRSLIVEQALGGGALRDAEIYSAGLDFGMDALPKALVSLDGYYYRSRNHSRTIAANRGTELDLKVTYQLYKWLELGVAGGYLFADSDFQDKDTKKLQTWFVLKF